MPHKRDKRVVQQPLLPFSFHSFRALSPSPLLHPDPISLATTNSYVLRQLEEGMFLEERRGRDVVQCWHLSTLIDLTVDPDHPVLITPKESSFLVRGLTSLHYASPGNPYAFFTTMQLLKTGNQTGDHFFRYGRELAFRLTF